MKTNPRALTAPLDETAFIDWTDPAVLRDELIRAQTELVWALNRQRIAWARFAAYNQEGKARPNWLPDTDRTYKLRSSDVSWWRDEVTSRATAVSALVALIHAQDLPLGPEWRETTVAGEGYRTFIRAR